MLPCVCLFALLPLCVFGQADVFLSTLSKSLIFPTDLPFWEDTAAPSAPTSTTTGSSAKDVTTRMPHVSTVRQSTATTMKPTVPPTALPSTTAATPPPTALPSTTAAAPPPTVLPTTIATTPPPTALPTTTAATPLPTVLPTTTAATPSPTVLPTPNATTPSPTALPTPNATTPSPTVLPTPNATTPSPTVLPTPNATTPSPTALPTNASTATTPGPTSPPRPTVGDYVVRAEQNSSACLMSRMGLQFSFRMGEGFQTVNLDPSPNVTKTSGVCGNDGSDASLVLKSETIIVQFIFTNQTSKFFLSALNLSVTDGSTTFTVHTSNLSLWEASLGSSYMCKKEQSFNISDTLILNTFDLQVQPFGIMNDKFSTAHECSVDDTSLLIPIIVGAALAVLILIVVIAYVIGRRKTYVGYQTL